MPDEFDEQRLDDILSKILGKPFRDCTRDDLLTAVAALKAKANEDLRRNIEDAARVVVALAVLDAERSEVDSGLADAERWANEGRRA